MLIKSGYKFQHLLWQANWWPTLYSFIFPEPIVFWGVTDFLMKVGGERMMWMVVVMCLFKFHFVVVFFLIYTLGKNNTQPLNNNDEISLSLKKHKGTSKIC